MNKKFAVGLILVALIVFLLDISLGSVKIPLDEIIKILFRHDTENATFLKIVEKIRIPKACTAALAGCALSVAGLLMQTLFRNPMAGPDVLGLTSGASLGVAIVVLVSGSSGIAVVKQMGLLGSWATVLAASLGSALVLLIVLIISMKLKDNVTLLIIGIMMGTLTISLVSLLLFFSSPDQVQEYLNWTFGSIAGVTGKQLFTLSVFVLFGLVLSFLASKSLNTLQLGENYARGLGLSMMKSRILIIAAASLLAGSVTAFCGPIAFVGLAVPHLCKAWLNSSDHFKLSVASCLVGSIIMLVCDIIVHSAVNQTVLPINVVTAFVGAPVVMWIIIKNRKIKPAF